jgi:hypothetical protein
MFIHPQYPARFQDHLVLETDPPFRIILYWTILTGTPPLTVCYNRFSCDGEDGARIQAGYCRYRALGVSEGLGGCQ